jgi:hypothetical protein
LPTFEAGAIALYIASRSAPRRGGGGATVAEAAGSHAIYVSKPEAVAALIAKAANSVSAEMAVR